MISNFISRTLSFVRLAALIYILAAVLPVSAQSNVIHKLKSNYRTILTPSVTDPDTLTADLIKIEPEKTMSDQVVIELHQRYPFDENKINRYLSHLQPDGSWTDINYNDKRRSGWEPRKHVERIFEMARFYRTPGTKGYESDSLRTLLHRALGYWFSARPKSRNWWQNQIGVPKSLGAACLLIEDELSAHERKGIIDVMSAAKIKMTGQNKVWLAGNVLIRGLLQNDMALVRTARDSIMAEIRTDRNEGIKPDWSFHQHGPQQQFGNYGMAYLLSMGFYHTLFKDTPLQFDAVPDSIMRTFINQGYRWIVWNRYMDISSLGRQLFHNAQLHKGYALAFVAANFDITGFPRHGNLLTGHKHFDYSDYTVHRSYDWMTSVKMSSSRIIGTEAVNEDNHLGYYLGDGATYCYRRGDEYSNIFPLWDWRKIPGTTAYEDEAPLPLVRNNHSNNRSPLVGGLTVGSAGVSAMVLDRDSLSARKAWLFSDDFVMCIGSGIRSDSTLNVTTAIDCRWLNGDLTAFDGKKWHKIEGKAQLPASFRLLYHDSIGYVIPDNKALLYAETGTRSGSWKSFMKGYLTDTVHGNVMSLHISHGIAPQNASYTYFMLPSASQEQVRMFDPSKHVRILRNDSEAMIIQSLSGNSKGIWFVSYTGAPAKIHGHKFIPEAPGIFFIPAHSAEPIATSRTLFRISGQTDQ